MVGKRKKDRVPTEKEQQLERLGREIEENPRRVVPHSELQSAFRREDQQARPDEAGRIFNPRPAVRAEKQAARRTQDDIPPLNLFSGMLAVLLALISFWFWLYVAFSVSITSKGSLIGIGATALVAVIAWFVLKEAAAVRALATIALVPIVIGYLWYFKSG